MKLTAQEIAKIEEIIADLIGMGHRGAVVKHGLRDMGATSSFLSVLRSVGVAVPVRRGPRGLSPEDQNSFREFVKSRRRRAT